MEAKWEDWHHSILLPLLQHLPGTDPSPALSDLLHHDNVDLALLAADTDRIQEYVFESAKLPEIRGGSELLQKLNLEELPHILEMEGLPKNTVLYAGGGGFLALVPASIADKLVSKIEQLYPNETGQATISCCVRRVTPVEIIYGLNQDVLSVQQVNSLQNKLPAEDWRRIAKAYGIDDSKPISAEVFKQEHGFGQVVQLMSILLRRRKDCPPSRPIFETLPFATRCRVCQIRPAEKMYTYFDELWPLCQVCWRKARFQRRVSSSSQVGSAREVRSYRIEEFLTKLGKDWPDLAKRYWAEVPLNQVHHAQDLNELGAACEARAGYIGFIYADGNRVGRMLEALSTPRSYRQFSLTLQTVICTATYKALAEHLHPIFIDRISPTGKPLGKGYIHPLELLLTGGDDVMLIVPGDVALPIAARLCQNFEWEVKHSVLTELLTNLSTDLSSPTLSVGVVIADSHNPVRVLQQLAKELCRNAKSRAYDEEQINHISTSALDFLLLKSQSMLRRDIKQLRQTPPYYYSEGPEAGRYLTAAPYTLAEYCRLLALLKLMRRIDFPTNQLQDLVATLHKGRQYSSVHYLYQQSRSKARSISPDEPNLLTSLPKIWAYNNQTDPIPWHQVPGKGSYLFASVLPDLLELYSFVPRFVNLSSEVRQTTLSNLWKEVLSEAGLDDNQD